MLTKKDKEMTMDEVRALEHFMKTCDRFGLMPKYVLMIEWWTKNIGHWGYVDTNKRELGVTIMMEGNLYKIKIVGDEDGDK
jgi:hypothetical protein